MVMDMEMGSHRIALEVCLSAQQAYFISIYLNVRERERESINYVSHDIETKQSI